MSDKATIDALGYWVSRLSARVKALEERPPCHCDSCKEMMRYQAAHPDRECGSPHYAGNGNCYLSPGHGERHLNRSGDSWGDLVPCACKEVSLDDGQLEKVTDKNYIRTTHYRECCHRVSPIPRPEPVVPEWRRLVNGWAADDADVSVSDPLPGVLGLLTGIAYSGPSERTTGDRLARIVAVCEAQVGDGWQADPDLPRPIHKDGRRRCDIGCLINALDMNDEQGRWATLGTRAAHWLRDITEDAS